MKTNENTDTTYQEPIDVSSENEVLYNERRHEELEERRANEAVKGGAWLLGIVAVFALAILITWIVGSQSPFLDRSLEREAAVLNHTKPLKAQMYEAGNKTAAQFVAHITSGNTQQATKATAPETVKATIPAVASNALSAADLDRIEREAREVIHGDYGVNPGRKAKLGADYEAVQARVNELLH